MYVCMKHVLSRWRKSCQSMSPHLVPNGCETLSPASPIMCHETKPTVHAATTFQLCHEMRWASAG